MKDWTGNENSVFSIIGSSVHSKEDREVNDYYSTDPIAIDYLLKYEKFDEKVWECACGNGNLSKRLQWFGYNVTSTDLVYRGFGGGRKLIS